MIECLWTRACRKTVIFLAIDETRDTSRVSGNVRPRLVPHSSPFCRIMLERDVINHQVSDENSITNFLFAYFIFVFALPSLSRECMYHSQSTTAINFLCKLIFSSSYRILRKLTSLDCVGGWWEFWIYLHVSKKFNFQLSCVRLSSHSPAQCALC